ncbi:hypothetical protein VP01_2528g4 [Puccinia sorghi]|uniref:Uncharacterized protein n=1 Tax=Puccinia sorghi TaxID=27349 RepID=A0A0L6V5B5_9BASI|nr:hypothetical protein VP01_2528g4 [Puccinia sorghi]
MVSSCTITIHLSTSIHSILNRMNWNKFSQTVHVELSHVALISIIILLKLFELHSILIYVHILLFYVHMLYTYFMYLFAEQSTEIIILMILVEIKYYNYIYAGFWILWKLTPTLHILLLISHHLLPLIINHHHFLSNSSILTHPSYYFIKPSSKIGRGCLVFRTTERQRYPHSSLSILRKSYSPTLLSLTTSSSSVSHYKKNLLNCLNLTCRNHCAYCTVTVPKILHMQTCGAWMAAWMKHAAFQLKAVEQVFISVSLWVALENLSCSRGQLQRFIHDLEGCDRRFNPNLLPQKTAQASWVLRNYFHVLGDLRETHLPLSNTQNCLISSSYNRESTIASETPRSISFTESILRWSSSPFKPLAAWAASSMIENCINYSLDCLEHVILALVGWVVGGVKCCCCWVQWKIFYDSRNAKIGMACGGIQMLGRIWNWIMLWRRAWILILGRDGLVKRCGTTLRVVELGGEIDNYTTNNVS